MDTQGQNNDQYSFWHIKSKNSIIIIHTEFLSKVTFMEAKIVTILSKKIFPHSAKKITTALVKE
jgi:hypothetical protein